MTSLALLSALLALRAAAWRAAGDTRPNIVINLPDTIRAEALSVYGHPFVSTPNAARMAKQGVVFGQAHVQHTGSPWAARIARQMRDFLGKFWLVKPKAASLESLAENLRRAA